MKTKKMFDDKIVYEGDIEHVIKKIEHELAYELIDREILIEIEPRLITTGEKVPYIILAHSDAVNDFHVHVSVTTEKNYSGSGVSERILSVKITVSLCAYDFKTGVAQKHLKGIFKKVYELGDKHIIDIEVWYGDGFRMKGGAEITAPFNPFLP